MRRKLVAGNWKMNQDKAAIHLFVEELTIHLSQNAYADEMLICPSFIHIPLMQQLFAETQLSIGAQNVAAEEKGAFTGEVSAAMLKDYNLLYCIVGHSERRQYYHETGDILSKKVERLHQHGIAPIFCCGELLPERKAAEHFNVVQQQLEEALWKLPEEMFHNITIAYEPVWAIGTGETATPDQAQEMHAFIRSCIEKRFGVERAASTRILYGGSVTPDNARQLFAMPDIDGGLIGGASMKASSFISILQCCKNE